MITMRLHQRTIDRCERDYASKAEAYFYGFACGVLVVLVGLVIIVTVVECFSL
jgi:hypothetical protein